MGLIEELDPPKAYGLNVYDKICIQGILKNPRQAN